MSFFKIITISITTIIKAMNLSDKYDFFEKTSDF